MIKIRVALKDARVCVQRKEEFISTAAVFSTIRRTQRHPVRDDTGIEADCRTYVVYSYGHHWPIFVYDFETQQWFENSDKFSVTTSKHTTMLCPSSNTKKVDTSTLARIASMGYLGLVEHRMLTNAA